MDFIHDCDIRGEDLRSTTWTGMLRRSEGWRRDAVEHATRQQFQNRKDYPE